MPDGPVELIHRGVIRRRRRTVSIAAFRSPAILSGLPRRHQLVDRHANPSPRGADSAVPHARLVPGAIRRVGFVGTRSVGPRPAGAARVGHRQARRAPPRRAPPPDVWSARVERDEARPDRGGLGASADRRDRRPALVLELQEGAKRRPLPVSHQQLEHPPGAGTGSGSGGARAPGQVRWSGCGCVRDGPPRLLTRLLEHSPPTLRLLHRRPGCLRAAASRAGRTRLRRYRRRRRRRRRGGPSSPSPPPPPPPSAAAVLSLAAVRAGVAGLRRWRRHAEESERLGSAMLLRRRLTPWSSTRAVALGHVLVVQVERPAE